LHKFHNLKSSYHFLKFSKNFSLAALAGLRFILHLEMKACNVLYQLHLCIYIFVFVPLSLTHSLQNSLKTRINCTKLCIQIIQCPKIVAGVAGDRKRGGGERREYGGNSAMVVGGIDAVELEHHGTLYRHPRTPI